MPSGGILVSLAAVKITPKFQWLVATRLSLMSCIRGLLFGFAALTHSSHSETVSDWAAASWKVSSLTGKRVSKGGRELRCFLEASAPHIPFPKKGKWPCPVLTVSSCHGREGGVNTWPYGNQKGCIFFLQPQTL